MDLKSPVFNLTEFLKECMLKDGRFKNLYLHLVKYNELGPITSVDQTGLFEVVRVMDEFQLSNFLSLYVDLLKYPGTNLEVYDFCVDQKLLNVYHTKCILADFDSIKEIRPDLGVNEFRSKFEARAELLRLNNSIDSYKKTIRDTMDLVDHFRGLYDVAVDLHKKQKDAYNVTIQTLLGQKHVGEHETQINIVLQTLMEDNERLAKEIERLNKREEVYIKSMGSKRLD